MTSTATTRRYPFEPDYAVLPGRTLQETIDTIGMDQRELATRTGLSAKHINQIIRGIAPITHETAIRLESATGVPASLWNNLEMNYREQLAKLAEKERLAEDLVLLREIPTAELIKRTKIEKQSDRALLLKAVLSFFGVANVETWKKLWQNPEVAFRKSLKFKGKPGPTATWLRLGELESQTTTCRPFDKAKFKAALDEIRGLTVKPPEAFLPRMKALCADAGVAVVLVREIAGAPVSGAAQWLTPEKAMIQLSLRHKTNDQFWFSFFHESGHILNDGKKEKFIDYDHEDSEFERAANRFASHFLIPTDRERELYQLKSQLVVKAFAKSLGIAPGIVVGRLQREKIVGHDQLNALKVRYQWVE